MPPRTIVITGASDGIGASAARFFTRRGDRVVVIGRSPSKTRDVAGELGADFFVADFARLDEVRALAGALDDRYEHIDVLANNAGGIMSQRRESADGHEMTLQVNHLAPFLLTNLLIDKLSADRSTVIATASIANSLYGRLDIDDLDARQKYSPNLAYGNAKLANILFTRELDRRFRSAGVSAAAFHPGIVSTGFAADSSSPLRHLYHGALGRFMMSPEKGADTLEWLATTTPGVDWVRGEYYQRRRPQRANRQAYDDALAAALWQRSAEMVGLG